MTQARFVVHSASQAKIPVQAQVGERTVTAEVDGLVVELDNGTHCHTHQFLPNSDEEAAALAALFEVGAPVIVTFAKE